MSFSGYLWPLTSSTASISELFYHKTSQRLKHTQDYNQIGEIFVPRPLEEDTICI